MYPGTDLMFPRSSLGVDGPIASLRLEYWRQGIQDADDLALAHAVDPVRTSEIANRIVRKAFWEVGVESMEDPAWRRGGISWSVAPDVWEKTRGELAGIIVAGSPRP